MPTPAWATFLCAVRAAPQVVHSLWHSNALPARGDHVREADALALMMHVLDCVRALR